MANFANILSTEQYNAVLTRLNEQITELSKLQSGSNSNQPTDAIRWNSAQARLEIYNGSSWGELAAQYNINVQKLQGREPSTGATANTIALRDAAGRLKASAPSASTDVARKAEVDAHTNRSDNPHGTTKVHVELGNVSNDRQLVRASNLSDLPSAGTARDNLGLGSAATRDVGTESGNLVLFEDIPQPGNASTSTAGLTEYATNSEHQSGVSNRSATPSGVNQMGFLKSGIFYESGEFDLDTASRTYIGYKNNAFMAQAFVRCKVSGSNYDADQELPIYMTIDGSNEYGAQVYISNGHIYLLQAYNGIRLFNNSGNPLASTTVGLSSSDWKLFVRVIAN
tara:strand:+ start:1570 stop:2589 length:1020 start_codon:yes stop_codon:yes gene_type:complete